MPTIQLLIKGKVQGVFYRASAITAAKHLQITGWIKNTPEGDVEAVANGSEEQLNQFANWCKQGPPLAKVQNVIITKVTGHSFKDFSIKR